MVVSVSSNLVDPPSNKKVSLALYSEDKKKQRGYPKVTWGNVCGNNSTVTELSLDAVRGSEMDTLLSSFLLTLFTASDPLFRFGMRYDTMTY